MRVRFVAEQTRIVFGRKYERHSVVDFGDEFVGVCRDDRKRANPFAGGRVLPVFPIPPMPNGSPSFMAMAKAVWPFVPGSVSVISEVGRRNRAAPFLGHNLTS